MRFDQNTVTLINYKADTELCTVNNPDDVVVLPGCLGEYSEEDPYIVFFLATRAIESFNAAVLLENGVAGTSIDTKTEDGEVSLMRRLRDGDVFLLRAVEGDYYPGQPLYATQRDNGIYVSGRGEGKFIGWCREAYRITPEMMDFVINTDPYGEESETYQETNLISVRIGYRQSPVVNPMSPITWEIKPDVEEIELCDSMEMGFTIEFSRALSGLTLDKINIEPKEVFVGVELNPQEETDASYLLTIKALNAEQLDVELTISIEDKRVEDGEYRVNVISCRKPVLPNYREVDMDEVTGFWGVVYPDLMGSALPTEDDILALTSMQIIKGGPREVTCAFALDRRDWVNAGGNEEEFEDSAVGRAFLLTSWEQTANQITQAGLPAFNQFSPFSIVIKGKEYDGYIASYPIVYDGETYNFVFNDVKK